MADSELRRRFMHSLIDDPSEQIHDSPPPEYSEIPPPNHVKLPVSKEPTVSKTVPKSNKTSFPPTYIVIEFEPNIKPETAQWIINKIRSEKKRGGADLLVRAQPYIHGQNLTLHVTAELDKLLELAEELEIRKLDNNGILREFTLDELRVFTHSKNPEELLELSEKQVLVRHELDNIRALPEDDSILGYPNIILYEGQTLLPACLHKGIIKQVYPLHDINAVRKLGWSWYLPLYNKQPYEDIRLYFGESIALYFQFLGFYTLALVGPMILGFIQLFMPPENLAYFCVLNIICATLFLEFWRRKCTELSFMWGTITMTSLDEPRPNFCGIMGKDCVTDRLLPQYPRWKTNAKMYCVSLPLVVVCMFGAFLVMLASFWVEDFLRNTDGVPIWAVYIPSTVYAGLIYAMNLVYRRFANYLTEWENHRTQSQFDRHRVTKLVLFEFVNNFMSLFYIAFIIQDMEMLRYQLATLLIIFQAINNIQEAVLPMVFLKYSMKQMKNISIASKDEHKNGKNDEFPLDIEQLDVDDTQIQQAVSEGLMDRYDDPYDDYLELFVQFGYVFLFSSIYPMAAFWAVFNNVLEIRSDAFKLCCIYQRPGARKVKDTGAWQRAFHMLCSLSVMTNCALLCLSPSLRKLWPEKSGTQWFLYFVLLEHLLLGLKQVLHYAIPDKPEWVRVALARINFLSKQALKRQNVRRRLILNGNPSKSIYSCKF